MSSKQQRHAALLQCLRRRPVASQQELVDLLEKHGFHATQASISRDLRELGLVKLDGRYLPVAQLASAAPSDENELINDANPVGANLIVVKTPIGAAGAVAVELDRLGLSEIAGTIAGDDTVFIAVRSRAAQGRVLARLRARRPVATP